MTAATLVVGRVVKAHGIRGEVAIEVTSDAPDRFAPGARFGLEGGSPLTVEASRPHQGRMLVKFAEVFDRTGAEALRGVELLIDEDVARPPPPGSFYSHQLEGCAVVDEQGLLLGEWARAEESPAHDLWLVRTEKGEVLIPAVKEVVLGVDLDARRIVVRPPEGLFG